MSWSTRCSITDENKFTEIQCFDSHEALRIIAARYGIFQWDRARCGRTVPVWNTNCDDTDVTNNLKSLCDNKPSCSIRAHSDTFNISDPCYGYLKFLGVQYECIEDRSTTTTDTTTAGVIITSQTSTLTEPPTPRPTESISTDIDPAATTPVTTKAFGGENRTSTPTASADSLPLQPGVIAGVAVGGLALLVIALLCFFILWRRKRNKTPQDGAEVKQNEIYEMNGAYDTSSPGPDESNNDYAFADDIPNHVTTPSNQQPDNPYSYADETNPADAKQRTMTDNILYGTQG